MVSPLTLNDMTKKTRLKRLQGSAKRSNTATIPTEVM
jgi:hypothetical protein